MAARTTSFAVVLRRTRRNITLGPCEVCGKRFRPTAMNRRQKTCGP